MKVRLGDIRPNPFRDLTHYRIDEDKVNALVNSIQSTTFWSETVLVREVEGTIEQAFGHHRIEAARRALGENSEVEVTLRDLSDADMLRMMAEENLREWKHDLSVQIQTVQAVIDAAESGRITLPEPNGPGGRPSEFSGSGKPQAKAVSTFLGGNWTFQRVSEIARHLDYFGEDAASELDGVAPSTAAEIVQSAEVQAKQAGLTGEAKKKAVRETTLDYASRIKSGEKYVLDKARVAAGKQPKHDARLRDDPVHGLLEDALRDPEQRRQVLESLTEEERWSLSNEVTEMYMKPLREDHARRKAIAEEQYEDPRKWIRGKASLAIAKAVMGVQDFIDIVRSERQWKDDERTMLNQRLDRVQEFVDAARVAIDNPEGVDWDSALAKLNEEEEVK